MLEFMVGGYAIIASMSSRLSFFKKCKQLCRRVEGYGDSILVYSSGVLHILKTFFFLETKMALWYLSDLDMQKRNVFCLYGAHRWVLSTKMLRMDPEHFCCFLPLSLATPAVGEGVMV